MINFVKSALPVAGLCLLSLAAVAQEPARKEAPTETGAAQQPASPDHQKARQQRPAHEARVGRHASGEAASLEQKEAGLNGDDRAMPEDNRGRRTVAHRAKVRHPQSQTAKAVQHGQRHATVVPANARNSASRTRQQHVPALKTGQLTSRDAARAQTKGASFQPAAGVRASKNKKKSGKKAVGPAPAEPEPSNSIQLKQHNARMF